MLTTTKFALVAAIVLSATLSATAAPKARVVHGNPQATSDVIPGYGKDGRTIGIPNPNR